MNTQTPLAIELFCGCFGWSAGWIGEFSRTGRLADAAGKS